MMKGRSRETGGSSMSRSHFGVFLLVAGLLGCSHTTDSKQAQSSASTLIPRTVFFENPTRGMPQVSPDGKWLAWLADHEGVMNVWVAPIDDLKQAKLVTQDKVRGIRNFFWAYTSQHLLYPQDEGGNENFHIYAADIVKGQTQDLTPYKNVAAQVLNVSPELPQEVLISLNDRDARFHDLYRINLLTAKRTPVVINKDGFGGFVTDDQYKVKMAIKTLPDGGSHFLVPGAKEPWSMFKSVSLEDALTTVPLGVDKSGQAVYAFDSQGRDTSALVLMDLKTKKSQVLSFDEKADASRVLMHPSEKTIQAVGFNFDRLQWKVLDKSIEGDLETLKKVSPGQLEVLSRTQDDKTWIVAYLLADGPVRYYRYDRSSGKTEFLFTNRPSLENLELPDLQPVIIKAQDGLDLVSYLTVPTAHDQDKNGRPDQPVPMVLLVHGGPWARDNWGFNSTHQWLANRGYAVLSVNYRGSTGFGKNFINAANFEWAGKMHQDLLDAVDWAVKEKIADPEKVAIFGGSYGGYATLVGLTFTPDRFACGVDIVGPSNLQTLFQTIPPYWHSFKEQFAKRVGDHRTEEGRKLLAERSPLHRADAIKKPLLIGQGANDPRVKQAESDQIVKALQEKNIPVSYVLYPDEGHGFARPQNRLSFNAVAEVFLSNCLGGAHEPIGDALVGSSIQVPTGADQIKGLDAALSKP
jgi:dipeptidyl aminopeptidase/acylaminoacyl peptidase